MVENKQLMLDDLDDYVFPPGYLKREQEENLRQGIGEELWDFLEKLEEEENCQPIVNRK